MIRVVSLVRLTDEGMRQLETFGEVVAKVRETVTKFGGSLGARLADGRRL